MRRQAAILVTVGFGAILWLAASARGEDAWAKQRCAYRRPVMVYWDSDNAVGGEIAVVEFLTAGHSKTDGGDVCVTTADGKEVDSRVLMVGPGDSVRVVFDLSPGVQQYDIYFGNPEAPPAQDISTFQIARGLLLEARKWNGQACDKAADLAPDWNAGGPILGRTMVDLPFIAGNPLGEVPNTLRRYGGELSVPQDGLYTFAAATSAWGALYIDGQPLLYAAGLTPHADFQQTLYLGGFYDLTSVAWRLPGAADFTTISRADFGIVSHARPGDLESRDGRPLADFSAENEACCPCDDEVTNRYTFTAAGADAAAQWDFGDGQTATGATVDHVYLSDGTYTVRIRQRGDEESSRLAAHQDWTDQMDPSIDPVWAQAKIVGDYAIDRIPASELGVATLMEAEAQNWPVADRMAARLAREKSHGDAGIADALLALKKIAGNQSDWQTAARVWALVPVDSDLQPQAAIDEAQWLVWRGADFDRAAARLGELAAARPDNPQIQQAFGEALVLDQQAERGAKILNSLSVAGDPRRRPAISGAFARTMEYYLDQWDADSAQEAWDKWDAADPTAFLEGYSVLLRVRLMALRHIPQPAAKVAEAFATAMPDSPYSPELLDTAAKLLETIDPAKSKQLRDLLAEKYPEDPLSQN